MGPPAAPGANEERPGGPNADRGNERLVDVRTRAAGAARAACAVRPLTVAMPGDAVIAITIEVAADTAQLDVVRIGEDLEHVGEQRRWQTGAASRLPPPHQARLKHEPFVHGHRALPPWQPRGKLPEEQVGAGQPTRNEIDPALVVELVANAAGERRIDCGFPSAEERSLEHRDKIGHMFDHRERTGVRQVENVTDVDDPRLQTFWHLNDAELRRKIEDREGVFVVEGITAIRRLFESDYEPVRVLTLKRRVDAVLEVVPDGVEVVSVDRALMTTLVGFDLHRGVVAVARRQPPVKVTTLAARSRRLVVLEALNDVENLGAIARTARAFGFDGLVVDPRCADPLYRRCIRVSMGEMLRLPFARSTAWPHDLDGLAELGYTTVALTPAADAEPIESYRPSAHKVALLLGAEWSGLSPEAFARCTDRVRITISPDVDSLNVGHAAAVACHRLASLASPS